ncbi:MAG: exo-alpha-sialidase, partial [Armatimonadaceae bacterium]
MNPTRREFLFTDPPFAECHASTIAPTADGGWLAAWFAGSHERHPDVAIWAAHRSPEGKWSAPKKIARAVEEAHWNPV